MDLAEYCICCAERPVAAARRRKGSWKLNRRFIVVEGIYANTGDVAPLAAIAALKHKCARLPYSRSGVSSAVTPDCLSEWKPATVRFLRIKPCRAAAGCGRRRHC